MGTPIRMPDGSVQVIDNDQIPDAVSKGATPPDTVYATLPGGGQTQVPWDSFLQLQKQAPGVGLASEDDLRTQGHLADLEDQTSTAGAFGRNFLSELSFGAYKPSDDQRLADSHYHGISSGLGKFGGAVGPLLVPGLGEESLIGRGAELAGAETAGEAGRAALGLGTEVLPGRIGAQLGAKVSSLAGGGFKGAVLGGAAEGAGADILRSVLDKDHPLSGESILDSAGMFAAGAGVGHGLAKAGEAFSKLSDRLGKGAVKSTIDDADMVARLEQNRPLTAEQRGTTDAIHGKDVLGNVQTDIPLFSANQRLTSDVSQTLSKVEAWQKSPLSIMPPEIAPTIERGIESLRVVKNFAKLEPEAQAKVMGAYEGHLHNIDEMIGVLRKNPGGLDLNSLPNRFKPENVFARQQAVSALNTEGMVPAQAAAQRLATRLTTGTGKVATGSVKDVADGLLSRIPVVGKTLSKLTGGSHPLASLFLLDQAVEHGVLHAAGPIGAVVGATKLAQKAFEVPGRGIALSGLAAENLAKLGVHSDLPTEKHARAQAVADRLKALSPDDARQMATKAAQHVAQTSPDTLVSAGNTAAVRQQALQARINEIFPQSQGMLKLRGSKPSGDQVRDLDRTLKLAGDPVAFATLLAQGKLSAGDMNLAKTYWPEHVSRAVRLASQWLADQDGKEVPRQVAKRLELLLGSEAVGQQQNDSAVAAQASIQASQARLQPKASPGPSSNPGGKTAPLDPTSQAGSRPTD